jgi:hypothetical protein
MEVVTVVIVRIGGVNILGIMESIFVETPRPGTSSWKTT